MTAILPKSHRPLVLAIALALTPGVTSAATIKVGSNQDNTTINDGLCTLREAIVSINDGSVGMSGCAVTGDGFGTDDTIYFAGLASPTITISGSELAINKSMTIYGSGQTIQVSGNLRAMQVSSGASLDLSTVTISGGNTSANGAALDVSQANATLSYVTITGNTGGYGAGIYTYNSTLSLTECTLSYNSASGFGGGLFATHGSVVTLDGTSVYGNSAGTGAGVAISHNASLSLNQSGLTGNSASTAAGGASAQYSSTLTINGGFVINNYSGSLAGGVYAAYSATLYMNRALLADNAASFGGGGEVKTTGRLVFNGTTISGNHAATLGAGLQGYGGTLDITDSTIVGNSADITNNASGGGVEMAVSGAVHVVNSTITGNVASVGGGLAVTGASSVALINATVTANTASGGGINLTLASSASLSNTILSGNTSPNQTSDYFNATKDGASTVSAFYCVLGTGPALASTPNNNPDHYNHFTNSPGLNSLSNNGGLTQTIAPMSSSPAIDNGKLALAKTVSGDSLSYDQRGVGFPRTLSGKVDIGAWQHQPDTNDRIFVSLFEAEP